MDWLIPQRRRLFVIVSFLGASFAATGASPCREQAGESIATVEIQNPSAFPRDQEVASLDLIDLGIPVGNSLITELTVIRDDRILPNQLVDTDADGRVDTLHVLVDLEAGESVQLEVRKCPACAIAQPFPKRSQAELSRKMGGHWDKGIYQGGTFVPVNAVSFPGQLVDHNFFMRYEGPGWESDKVGFRMYLDQRNAMDVFGKRIPGMVLQDVGLDGYDSYHEDAAWGLDILKVGEALGPGGIGQWNGKQALRVSNTERTECRIVHNGPVTSSFKLDYTGWKTPGEKRDQSGLVSISAGSWLSRITLSLSRDGAPLATGIPKHPEATPHYGETDIPGNSWTWLASYGKQSLDGANLGMVIFVKREYLDQFTSDDHNELVVFQKRGAQVTYHVGAVWEGRSEIACSEASFLDFVRQTADRLNRPLRIRISSAAMRAKLEACPPLDNPAAWTRMLADSILQRRGDSLSNGYVDPVVHSRASWRYTTGLLSLAFHQLGEYLDDPRYTRYADSTIASFVGESGNIETYTQSDYNIDKINSGKMLLSLYERTHEERFKKAAEVLLKQLETHPRTSGGAFWHKQRYPGQVWLDGVYMAAPFLVQSGVLFDHPEWIQEAGNEFSIVREHLFDETTGLYYHGWDELKLQTWANPQSGVSETFWGRGMGWYAMALVDCLDYLPPEDATAQLLRTLLVEFAASIERWQDPETGLWSQIVHQKNRTGNYFEASASAMFTYTLAKGVNKGYLDRHYAEVAQRGFDGMVRHFMIVHPDGTVSLDHICRVAGLGFGRDGSYDYYMVEPVVKNDEKGLGPFLMAGVEIDRFIQTSER